MAEPKSHDLIVIGAGPGGYVAAIRAAQLGLDAACVEVERRLGGTCLRVGCIPSKAMLESSELYHKARHGLGAHGISAGEVSVDVAGVLRRKDGIVSRFTKGIEGLFRKNKVTRYHGRGRLTGPGTLVVEEPGGGGVTAELTAKHIIIATGSQPSTIPGVEIDHQAIGTSTDALSYESTPGKLVVIGAGVIGLELGQVWKRLGAEVIVLEYLDRILPGMDAETAQLAQSSFEKQGLVFRLGSRVTSARTVNGRGSVEVDGGAAIACEKVLVAVGRKPNTGGLGLEAVGIETDDRGRIPVDVGHTFQTAVPGLYAIGDVIEGPMLAHKAEEEAVACVERIATGYGHVNYDVIPGVVYTHPEIASVGKTEEELNDAGVAYKKGAFPFMANGRARAMDDRPEGQAKILADARTDRILGVHIVGPLAGELIAEAAAAMEFGASAEDLARTCHAHPTLAEALKEAALAVDGRPIHI